MTIDEQIAVLTGRIETLQHDLDFKSDKVSYLQLRAWRKNLKKLKKLLTDFEKLNPKQDGKIKINRAGVQTDIFREKIENVILS